MVTKDGTVTAQPPEYCTEGTEREQMGLPETFFTQVLLLHQRQQHQLTCRTEAESLHLSQSATSEWNPGISVLCPKQTRLLPVSLLFRWTSPWQETPWTDGSVSKVKVVQCFGWRYLMTSQCTQVFCGTCLSHGIQSVAVDLGKVWESFSVNPQLQVPVTFLWKTVSSLFKSGEMHTANAWIPHVSLICNRSVFSEELTADTNHKAPCAHDGVTNHINHTRCETSYFKGFLSLLLLPQLPMTVISSKFKPGSF